MMQITCPFSTWSPELTNEAAPGEGDAGSSQPFQVIALGTVSRVEGDVSTALAPAYAEIAAAVEAAPVVNCDETPWRAPGEKPPDGGLGSWAMNCLVAE